ncbi:MAG: MBOAT family protein [Bacteroidetes bacterium]|nr:MBOAT family protein [Bacteroidota bacterium]
MLFNSIPFLLFIALFFVFKPLFWVKDNRRWFWILIMSCLFYGWWDWRFLFLLLGTGTIDYLCGKYILGNGRKKWFLWLSVVSNIASLVLFKYSLFIAGIIEDALNLAGFHFSIQASIPEFTLVLPVGISFYTFNSLSYTIDLYRGKAKPAESWLHFMAFISFFPHLVAGPIIRARDILSQLRKSNPVDSLSVWNGVKTCIWGYFQKMVLADNLAVFVNLQFDTPDVHSGTLNWWMCMLAFTFQIYFDFNGYSTIARGIAKICGIHFKLNFNHPYRASGFSDFWKRWHISLSSFFRDYVYISMGGNKGSKLKTEFNRMFTMLLSGLWHGANWTFVLWGAAHGCMLSIENILKRWFSNSVIKSLWPIFTFIVVVLTWVLFRAKSLNEAMLVYQAMLSWYPTSIRELILSNAFIFLVFSAIIEWVNWKKRFTALSRFPFVEALFYACLVAITIFFRGPEQQFIYFQF